MPAELVDFAVVPLGPVRVIGKKLRCKLDDAEENPIPAFWDQCFREGIIKKLEQHPQRLCDQALVGWMGELDPGERTFSYLLGILAEPHAQVPDEMDSVDLPEVHYAVGTIRGTEPDIYQRAHGLTETEMAKAKLQFNFSLGYEMEWYDERFCQEREFRLIAYYIPVL